MRRPFVFRFIFFILLIVSCCKEGVIVDDNISSFIGSMAIIGEGDFIGWKGDLACQGCAIYNDVIYEARHSGVCDVYFLNGDNIRLKTTMQFKSGNSNNHFNCLQFDLYQSVIEAPIVYISSHYRAFPCFVERISNNNTQIVQTICVDEMNEVPKEMYFNIVPGDSETLWLCGFFDNTLRIIQLRKPSLDNSEALITKDDIIDLWDREDYVWEQEVLQGMKYYNNRLYVVYGGSTGRRGIWVWNTTTHELIYNIDLTNIVKNEFEDVEIYNGKLYLFVLDDYILCFDIETLI